MPAAARVRSADVPLRQLPSWLGVDRALVGWRAWQRSGGPVLVADAGTALSLTRITADGAFAGGRLLAGAALQLRALRSATAALPALEPPFTLPVQRWPRSTDQAMLAGVLGALAAAIAQAARDAWAEDPGCSLWITGGDGQTLAPQLQALLEGSASALHASSVKAAPVKAASVKAAPVNIAPQLALEALAALRPGPGR